MRLVCERNMTSDVGPSRAFHAHTDTHKMQRRCFRTIYEFFQQVKIDPEWRGLSIFRNHSARQIQVRSLSLPRLILSSRRKLYAINSPSVYYPYICIVYCVYAIDSMDMEIQKKKKRRSIRWYWRGVQYNTDRQTIFQCQRSRAAIFTRKTSLFSPAHRTQTTRFKLSI